MPFLVHFQNYSSSGVVLFFESGAGRVALLCSAECRFDGRGVKWCLGKKASMSRGPSWWTDGRTMDRPSINILSFSAVIRQDHLCSLRTYVLGGADIFYQSSYFFFPFPLRGRLSSKDSRFQERRENLQPAAFLSIRKNTAYGIARTAQARIVCP